MSATVGTRAATPARASVQGSRLALVAAVAAGAAIGALGSDAGPASDLLVLLRFMAAVKAAMVLAASMLLWWRLDASMPPGTVAAYAAASGVMAAGPGLIWHMDHVALGAMAVHGGLSALLVLAWLDRAGWNGVLNVALARRRRAG